jgi:hypothetical protein
MSRAKRVDAWGAAAPKEPRWPAQVAIVCAALLNFALPGKFTLGPPWLVPALEFALLVPLLIVSRRREKRGRVHRAAAVVLIGIVNAANVISLYLLIRQLLFNAKNVSGTELLYSSIAIWITNVIVFSLWFWELDRGGPDDRQNPDHDAPDFLFPQMVTPGCTVPNWFPTFFDYLYVSFTNATAFSPTDTMPLTRWAKLLMLIESLASLATIAIVASRAINILS